MNNYYVEIYKTKKKEYLIFTDILYLHSAWIDEAMYEMASFIEESFNEYSLKEKNRFYIIIYDENKEQIEYESTYMELLDTVYWNYVDQEYIT